MNENVLTFSLPTRSLGRCSAWAPAVSTVCVFSTFPSHTLSCCITYTLMEPMCKKYREMRNRYHWSHPRGTREHWEVGLIQSKCCLSLCFHSCFLFFSVHFHFAIFDAATNVKVALKGRSFLGNLVKDAFITLIKVLHWVQLLEFVKLIQIFVLNF